MRYLIQFLIPALLFAAVVYLLTRQRRHQQAEGRDDAEQRPGSDTAAFLTILALGAVVALGTAFALQSFWE
jgi:hypothetical protein